MIDTTSIPSGDKTAYVTQGLQLQMAGQLQAAADHYLQALRLDPNYADALHLLGLVHNASGQPQQAVELIQKAIAVQPHFPAAYCNLGTIAWSALKDINGGRQCLEIALQQDGNLVDGLRHLAKIYFEQARYADAEVLTTRLVQLVPRDYDALLTHGKVLLVQGKAVAAETPLEQALNVQYNGGEALIELAGAKLHQSLFGIGIQLLKAGLAFVPENSRGYRLLGDAYRFFNDKDQCRAAYEKAIQLNRNNRDAWCNYGNFLFEIHKPEEAVTAYKEGLASNPGNKFILNNLGCVLQTLGRPEEAMSYFQIALENHPGDADTLSNMALTYQVLGNIEKAYEVADQAYQADPKKLEYLINKANTLIGLNRVEEAIALDETVLAIDPKNQLAKHNIAQAQLANGQLVEGFRNLEARWDTSQKAVRPNLAKPALTSVANLQGKRLYIFSEQGYGDTLMSARYLPLLAAAGAILYVDFHTPVSNLLRSLDCPMHFIPPGSVVPDFDYYCPMMSLPYAFGTTLETIPQTVPYLKANPDKVASWGAKLSEGNGPRIGLTWSGNPRHTNDSNRSIGLKRLAELTARFPAAQYFCIQKEFRKEDIELMKSLPAIRDLSAELTDFDETAAVMANLDLIISVDTSVVHLAGALGRPTIVLLPFSPDWRWLLNREDSPWYPSMKLLRQPKTRDWDSVLNRLEEELRSRFPQN